MTLIPATPFDSIRLEREDGSEFWSARDLQPLLEYVDWRKFNDAIERARAACDNAGQDSRDHFVPAARMVEVGSGARREVLDYHLSRHACYLTAINGDSRKPAIAAAQNYFAVRTRQAELAAQVAPALPVNPDPLLAQLEITMQIRREQLELQAEVQTIRQELDLAPIQGPQIRAIYERGQRLGQLMGNYRRAWGLFRERFGLASYRDLPRSQFEAGVQFLDMQISAWQPSPLLPGSAGPP